MALNIIFSTTRLIVNISYDSTCRQGYPGLKGEKGEKGESVSAFVKFTCVHASEIKV